MEWLFPNAFEYRGHRCYFCNGDGQVYPLNPGEAGAIAFRLAVVLAMGTLGFGGWALFSMYIALQLHLISSGAASPTWLVDSSVIYPVVFSYWGVTCLLSGATWFGLSLKFTDREPAPHIHAARQSGSLRATKPLPTLALALFACAFVGQGFGDACVGFRGTGTCDFITFTWS